MNPVFGIGIGQRNSLNRGSLHDLDRPATGPLESLLPRSWGFALDEALQVAVTFLEHPLTMGEAQKRQFRGDLGSGKFNRGFPPL
jgi:hypothetical protein